MEEEHKNSRWRPVGYQVATGHPGTEQEENREKGRKGKGKLGEFLGIVVSRVGEC